MPELPLGQVYFESYQLWWIGEEARTAFHKRSARNEKHLSQLLGVGAVSNSYMRRFELVKSQYEIVVFHPQCDG